MRPPSPVIPDVLYVGPARPMRDLRDFKTVVNLARQAYDGDRIHFPLHDGPNSPEAFAAVLDVIDAAVCARRVPIYLHCAAGHSRSPVTCALYLIRSGACRSWAAAFARVKWAHRSARPNARIVASAVAALAAWRRVA